jgi:FPC/CPF motif-containing protein YcgG
MIEISPSRDNEAWDASELLTTGSHFYPLAEEIHAAFRAFLHDPEFPCLGAKSVVNQHSYRFGLYKAMTDAEDTLALAGDLYQFIRDRASMNADFTSFVACFLGPKILTPKRFETLLWRQLHHLHLVDRQEHGWSDKVSSDPEDSTFSFSFGGEPFFIVGLSPSSERWARRFPWPLLVFNDHDQFERLREQNRFERLKDQIRYRDEQLHGSANGMLEDYGGVHSEARQYSGRQVDGDWRCPVHFQPRQDASATSVRQDASATSVGQDAAATPVRQDAAASSGKEIMHD